MEEWSAAENRYIYLAFMPVFLVLVINIYKTGKRKPVNIIAKRQSYWSIPSKSIYRCYKNRIFITSDRVETKLDTADKLFTKRYSEAVSFSGNIVLKSRNIKLTKVMFTDEIKNFQLYSLVFNKIKSILKVLEKDVDFESSLKENDMCIEYFLLDLWERFTKNFNIGTANLEVYAVSDIQIEFIGALDNISLNSIKRNGAVLLYMFMKFKNRLSDNGNVK
jgi:hypothetical protein